MRILSLNFRTKIILLSLLPIIFMSALLTLLSINNSLQLGKRNVNDFKDKIIEIRREELKNYIELALSAIEPIYAQSNVDDKQGQEAASEVLRNLRYGEDGYFFALTYNGIAIAHSTKPHLEGQDLWHLRDTNDVYFVRSLINQGKQVGGGYTQYIWEKPSLQQQVDKLSYSQDLYKWRWVLGTGLYMDDVSEATAGVEQTVENNTRFITLVTVGVSLFFTLVVGFIVVNFSISQGRLATRKLQKLTAAYIEQRDVERTRVAAVLHNEITDELLSSIRKLKLQRDESSSDDPRHALSTQVLGSLNQVLARVGEVANGLHPDTLVSDGIFKAVELLAFRLSESSGVKINAAMVDALDRPPLAIETTCYQVVAELLENVILHSNATEVSVRIRYSRNLLTITVQDNGIGFDPEEEVVNVDENSLRGVGLWDIQRQVELLNGMFSLFSSRGTGTMVKISIPMQTDNKNKTASLMHRNHYSLVDVNANKS